MPEVRLRYQNTCYSESRFEEGDVIYRYSKNSSQGLIRLVVDSVTGINYYRTYLMNEAGRKIGSPVMLTPERSKGFDKDHLATNLLFEVQNRIDNG